MSEENRLTRAMRAAEDDLKCRVTYIKEGKVKALRTESGHRHRERERLGVWLNLKLRDWVSCSSRRVPMEKTENSAHERLNLSLLHFLASLTQLALTPAPCKVLSAFMCLPGQTGHKMHSPEVLVMVKHYYTDARQLYRNIYWTVSTLCTTAQFY